MKKLLIICSILILFTGKAHSFELSYLFNIQDMIGLITNISDIAMGRHDLMAGNLFEKKVEPTLTVVNKLSEEISELTQVINVKMDNLMSAVLVNFPKAIQLANFMQKLIDCFGRIDELYEDYLFYVRKYGEDNEYTIEKFSKDLASHKFEALPDILIQVYDLFLPGQGNQEEDNLFDVMMPSLESLTTEERCNLLKTSQQQMYDLYEAITISEIKGHTMATHAYGALAIYQNTSFDSEIQRVTDQTISRYSEYFTAVHDALGRLVREVFLCDPPVHIKGETHVELNAMTGIMTHEKMMFESCYYHCLDINSYGYREPYSNDDNYWDPNQPCRGRIYNCYNIGDTNFCELPPEYGKRYSWVKSDDNGILGTKDDCKNGTEVKLSEDSGFYQCHVCFCQCSEEKKESKAIRTFSLRPQISDIDNNMVVTGVRFEKKDMMIHVQIEEGKLLRAGQIEKSSIRWKELEDFKYSFNDGNFYRINRDEEVKLEDGVDYQFIRYRQRDVYLDNVYSQAPGYVVTGLKLSQDPKNSKAIQLDIYVTPFDFLSGLLKPNDDNNPSKWITHKDMVDHDRLFTQRKELDVTNLRRGDDFTDNIPDTGDFWDVWFVTSNIRTDASQSTIPFLDRQTAAPFPRVALSGVSLFHRGKDKSGGFIGFKLQTVNLYDYMNV